MPALFVYGTANAELSDLPIGAMAPVLAGSVILTALALVLVQSRLRVDGPAFTSVVQGSIRFNNYLGLSMTVTLYGEQGVALAAITNAILVPVVNVLCTIAFARYGTKPLSIRGTLRSLSTNPLILACAVGIILNLTGVGLPAGVADLVRALGSASLPLGLLCVGAALQINSIGRNLLPIAYASAINFLILPAIAVAGCLLLGLAGPPAEIMVLFLALPTASSAYIKDHQGLCYRGSWTVSTRTGLTPKRDESHSEAQIILMSMVLFRELWTLLPGIPPQDINSSKEHAIQMNVLMEADKAKGKPFIVALDL